MSVRRRRKRGPTGVSPAPQRQGAHSSDRQDADATTAPARRADRLRVYGFILTFVLLMGAFYAIYYTPITRDSVAGRLFPAYLRGFAEVSGGILHLLGRDDVQVIGTTIRSSAFAVMVAVGCDATDAMALVVLAILAFPARWKRRLVGVVVGVFALAALNVGRIISLFLVGERFPAVFEILHIEIWQPTFILLAVLFWVLWVRWALRDAPSITQPVSKLGSFLARLVVIYLVLVFPWPGWRAAYASGFHAAGNTFFHQLGDAGRALFIPYGEGPRPDATARQHGRWDTTVILKNDRLREGLPMPMSARNLGYMPVAVLLTFLLATRMRWRRRLFAMALGLVIVHGFVWLRVWLPIVEVFSRGDDFAVYTLSPFWRGAVDRANMALAQHPTSFMILPMLIWAMLAFRLEDWTGKPQSATAKAATPAS